MRVAVKALSVLVRVHWKGNRPLINSGARFIPIIYTDGLRLLFVNRDITFLRLLCSGRSAGAVDEYYSKTGASAGTLSFCTHVFVFTLSYDVCTDVGSSAGLDKFGKGP